MKFSVGKIIKLIVSLLLLMIIVFVLCKFFLYDRTETLNEPIDYFADLYFEDISENKEIGKAEEINNVNNNIRYKVKYPVIGNEEIDKEIKSIVDNLISLNEEKNLTNNSTVNKYYFLDYKIYVSCDNLISLVFNEVVNGSNLKVVSDTNYSYVFNIETKKKLEKDDIFKYGYESVIAKYLKDDIGKGYYYVIRNDKIVLNDSIEIPFTELKDYLNVNTESKKTYSNDVKEVVYKVVNKKYVSKVDTVIYSKDDVNSEKLVNIKKGIKVNVFRSGENGFSVVLFDSVIGFVQNKDIEVYKEPVKEEKPVTNSGNNSNNDNNNNSSDKKEEPEDVTNVKGTIVYATTDVNIRSSASAKSKKLGELKYGESIEKIGYVKGWAKVKYNGKAAYITNDCLSPTKLKSWTKVENVPPQGAIDPSKPMVVLTFDDGPNNTSTVKILNTLEKYNVKATFFDQGNKMLKYPEIAKREARIGEVGTHTYSHSNLNKLSEEKIKREIELSKETFKKVMGYEPKLFRAPYGNSNSKVLKYIDMPVIYWTIDTLDWKTLNVNAIMSKVDKRNLDGKIILLHSVHSSTAAAVEVMVPYLLDAGYQLVTVSELAQYRGYTLQPGKIYYDFYVK